MKDERQPPSASNDPLLSALLQGSRRALAQAITLSESQRALSQARARELLRALQAQRAQKTRGQGHAKGHAKGFKSVRATRRIGITGAPGAGKSTLIASLCQRLLARQKEGSIAVFASDPSAIGGGGAVLADKTRMGAIVSEQRIFIRPSPASAQRTLTTGLLESMLLCEACGYETQLVESVGAGQAETAIDDYVDCLLLLIAPGSGDALQGMKRGLVELVDILVVTKADGALEKQAHKTLEDYRSAVRGQAAPEGEPETRATQFLVCSAEDSGQVEALCQKIDAFFLERSEQALQRRRALQRKNLFLRAFAEGAVDHALGVATGRKLLASFRDALDSLAGEETGDSARLPAEIAAEWFAALEEQTKKQR